MSLRTYNCNSSQQPNRGVCGWSSRAGGPRNHSTSGVGSSIRNFSCTLYLASWQRVLFYIEKNSKLLQCSLQFFGDVFTDCDEVSRGTNPLGSSVFEKEASVTYCLKEDTHGMSTTCKKLYNAITDFDKLWLKF